MNSWSIITVIMFVAFVLMTLALILPTREKPYKDAEKLALKEENDPPITPRHSSGSSDKRTKS